ncbi:MAG: S8 family serine peptidase [Gemmatimonas sp.]|uniref:S8 family serine peptidase n=1 Tax=Gemmatimonas sp. TaxID=1962908 RepID=UPI00391CB8C5
MPIPVRLIAGRPATILIAVLLQACARATPTPVPAPAAPPLVVPAPVVQPPITVSPVPAAPPAPAAADTARTDWHRLDYDSDRVLGVGSERALRELLAGRQPQREVLVAVIDGGIDTAHTYLRGRLWRNAREVAGNGRDDDANGYTDDVWGWNFMVTPSGQAVGAETFELTRLYAACRGTGAGRGLARPSAARCDTIATAYRDKVDEVTGTLGQIRSIERMLAQVTSALEGPVGAPLTRSTVQAFVPTNAQQEQARRTWLQLDANGLGPASIADARKAYESQATHGLDSSYFPRAVNARGSADVTGPDAGHGTHVAGIIGAERNPANAMMGIAPNVRLMALRAVPDGDERDEDVARAIRYAVDHGAQIVNMSFGKAFSPNKAAVDSAVRYAQSKGVLLVHAAGNDGENNDVVPSFPTPALSNGTRATLWLEVGASSWKGTSRLATAFSNYGQQQVDVFAPGEDILSTVPGGGVKREDGTSMAAPVVSGVAALLLAYFPTLTPADVRDIIVQSVRTFPGLTVALPGSEGQQVPFASLSRTGGLVDAYAAVKLALQREALRP